MLAILGGLLAWLVGGLLRVRTAHVLASLERAGVPEPRAVARRMYRSLGTGVFELIALALRPRSSPHVHGLEAVVAAVRAKAGTTGVVVATAHTGNWDYTACALARQVDLTVITKRLSVSWLDRWWQGLRASRSVRLLQAGSAARLALAALRRGGWVVAMLDQAPERTRGVACVRFLGAVAEVDLAPALLALRARCPLVVACPKRTASGHAVELLGVLEPPPGAGRVWATFAMREATTMLEQFVRRHPEQWLWMHRRWKRTAASERGEGSVLQSSA
ncbi:MAG TPA: lysophospholipid acyltransferase family protein [Polyangiaceae bacterium]|nr:lysophospholipid acyltransferase family protein [Polyangiaceae bacterium]